MENVIDLQKLWKLVIQHWIFIIILAVIGAGSSFVVSKYVVTKKYAATVSLLVNSENDSNNPNLQFANQQADVQLISTYKNIVTQPIILNDVARNLSTNQKVLVTPAKKAITRVNRLGEEIVVQKAVPATYKYQPAKYDIKASTLAKMISITNDTNSQVFNIMVKSTNPQQAADIANEIAKVFKAKIVKLMNVKNVNVVSAANANKIPVAPNVKLITLVGLLLGIIVALGIVVIRDLTDRTIKSLDFLKDELEINDLGTMYLVGNMKSYQDYVNEKGARKINDDKNVHRRRV